MFQRNLPGLSILFLFSLLSCTSSGSFPEQYRKDQIHFGQGGGFSGILNYFVLLEDGRLYQRAFRDSTMEWKETWSREFTSQMFANYALLHLDTIRHYEPGDLYYFLEYRSRDQPRQRIVWGKPGFRPDENTIAYYNLLYKSTKSKP